MTAGRPRDGALLDKLATRWTKRAGVTMGSPDFEAGFDLAAPDYPIAIVPFRDHPRFVDAPPEQRSLVLSWAWIAYNLNTIRAEENVANPAFRMILQGCFAGSHSDPVRTTVAQAIVDESYHTLLHLQATAVTCQRRGIRYADDLLPESPTCLRLEERRAAARTSWERNVLTLAFAIVSEVSINAYLTLLAEAQDIQRLNRTIADLHNRDEWGHALLLLEASKSIYARLEGSARSCFIAALVPALTAFVSHDFSVWRAVLGHAGLLHADEVIGDCEQGLGERSLVRDYSGLHRLARELEIVDDLDFDFEAGGLR